MIRQKQQWHHISSEENSEKRDLSQLRITHFYQPPCQHSRLQKQKWLETKHRAECKKAHQNAEQILRKIEDKRNIVFSFIMVLTFFRQNVKKTGQLLVSQECKKIYF